MELEPPPGGVIIDDMELEPPPGGTIINDTPKKQGPSFMDSLTERIVSRLMSGDMSSPLNPAGAIVSGAAERTPSFFRGVQRKAEPVGADMASEAMNVAGGLAPQVAASGLAAALTGGASLPAQALAQAGASGMAEFAQGAASGAPSAKEAAKASLASLGVDSFYGAAGKAFKLSKPGLVKLGSQLIRSTSAVPEKYGKAVLENPRILTEAPTLRAASTMYRQAVQGMAGAREFLEKQTGDMLFSTSDAVKMVNDANGKIAAGTLGLQEALASRQAASNLLMAAKMGNPEQRVNKAALLEFKDQADDLLEKGLPGFKNATRDYFEANARDAFQSIAPQNRNMGANALRSLGAFATMGAGALLHAPIILAGAVPFSPKMTGWGIRAGATVKDIIAAQAAQFAARTGAVQAVKSREARP